MNIDYQPGFQAIIHVDATPDDDYPARILRAYLANEENVYVVGDGPLPGLMMEWSRQRANALRKALKALEGGE